MRLLLLLLLVPTISMAIRCYDVHGNTGECSSCGKRVYTSGTIEKGCGYGVHHEHVDTSHYSFTDYYCMTSYCNAAPGAAVGATVILFTIIANFV